MAAEFGLTAGCVFPRDFYGKGGAPATGALHFSDFLGRSASAAFNPAPGTYNVGDPDKTASTSFTITSSTSVVWTWSKTGATQGTADVANGSSATQITFTVTAPINTTKGATFTVTAGGQSWTITLTADGTGGPA